MKSELANKLISLGKAAQILGVSSAQIGALGRSGKLQLIDVGKNGTQVVSVQSIEAYCEALRTEFGIKPRRRISIKEACSPSGGDLLPFPLMDTIGREEALEMLYSSRSELIRDALRNERLNDLHFEMYRLTDSSPWRVSRSSVLACARGRSKAAELKEGE